MDDKTIRDAQLQTRESKTNTNQDDKPDNIKEGDTVTPVMKQPKHKAKDMFLVTSKDGTMVTTQKLQNPLVLGKTKL